MKLLEGKTALITGASRGIGKAIAIRFAQEGANIAFTDLVRNEVMEATEKELSALGVKAKGYASNAADFADTARVVAEIEKDFGRVDALVNNAGITTGGMSNESGTAQTYDRRAVGRRYQRQSEIGIQFYQGDTARYVASGFGQRHQYEFGSGCQRQRLAMQLLRIESRYNRFYKIGSQRDGCT